MCVRRRKPGAGAGWKEIENAAQRKCGGECERIWREERIGTGRLKQDGKGDRLHDTRAQEAGEAKGNVTALMPLAGSCTTPDSEAERATKTHMREHLLHQLPVLSLLPRAVKDADSSATSQAVSRHFQLVHGVDVLHVEFSRRSIWRTRKPEVEVFVSAGLEVEGVVTRVQIRQLVDQVQGGFRVELGV